MLLAEVVLGSALTALGASESSHILITIFGALNAIIAGLVAYLESRGQPRNARMYRDDLERVVNEIENSELMWLGIRKRVNGYEDIITEGPTMMTVRSEVARLTRLYDRAVRNNTANGPDKYVAESMDGNATGAVSGSRAGQLSGALVAVPAAVGAPLISVSPGQPPIDTPPPAAPVQEV